MRKTDVRSDGRIRKSAFKPSSNGKDRDALSVSIVDPGNLELHRAKYDRPEKAVASIVVSDVLQIGLNVVADANEEDPGHALITGIPDITASDEEKRQAERFADLLANKATVYHFPALHNSR
jgi:hypothetical protein